MTHLCYLCPGGHDLCPIPAIYVLVGMVYAPSLLSLSCRVWPVPCRGWLVQFCCFFVPIGYARARSSSVPVGVVHLQPHPILFSWAWFASLLPPPFMNIRLATY
jgi:hypothetical protein